MEAEGHKEYNKRRGALKRWGEGEVAKTSNTTIISLETTTHPSMSNVSANAEDGAATGPSKASTDAERPSPADAGIINY